MNPVLQFSPKQYFYIIGSVIISILSLYYAKGFFIPFSFSLLFAFILMEPVKWLEKKKIPSILAISIVFFAFIGISVGITYFFSSQIASIVSDFNNFRDNFASLLDSAINRYNSTFEFLPPIDQTLVKEKITDFFKNSGGIILSTTFTETSSFLTNLFLVFIYVFLLLLYRKGIKKGITFFFHPNKRKTVETILYDIQGVGKSYILGLITVMFILSIVYSTLLLIIGIDYAIMFGCLAAFLIIIPYIGAYIGSALPILYALATMGPQEALVVLIAFVIIQNIEGNILTPKIVGSNTSVNPLTAFMAIIIFGYIWGIPGMILAIPITAMFKKTFRHIAGLQPLALLMGEELYENDIIIPECDEIVDIPEKQKIKNKPSISKKIGGLMYKLLFKRKNKSDS